jgi:arylsulfatase A-like enzyme
MIVDLESEVALSTDEVTVADLARSAGYATSLVGKWHLTPIADGWLDHPAELGFDHHVGSMNNLGTQALESDRTASYRHWEQNRDGVLEWRDDYATVATTDDALAAIGTLQEPWFLLVAYNAAHMPWHVPPGWTGPEPATAAEKYDAALEIADAEVGRLLDGLGPLARRTAVLLMSDNGTPADAREGPLVDVDSKGSWQEGAVRVPLVVTGPFVARPGAVSDAFVSVVDVLPTVAEIAGASLDDGVARDGASLLPWLADPDRPSGRDVLYAEKFRPNGPPPHDEEFRFVRDAGHRYVWTPLGEHLYRQGPGPLDESPDLLLAPLAPDDAAALERLRGALAAQDAAFEAD